MADIISLLANYNPAANYEQMRLMSTKADAQAMDNAKNARIYRLEDQLASLSDNPYAQYNIYNPQGRRQQLMSDEEQLGIASRWANSIKNLAPEKREQGYQQFLQAMPTLGIDVSDMPQGYDEGYIEQLAGYGIDPNTQYANEMALERQKLADEQAMRRMYAQDALATRRAQIQGTGLTSQQKNYDWAIRNGATPQQAMALAFGGGTNELGGALVEGSLFGQKGGEILSKEQAKNYAEDLNEYNNMLSKMPELQDTVANLKNLASKATYTTTGQIYDRIKQEQGRPTEGSIARDEYESIIANQILPLLRDTFGAQFTEREGNSLKATLGDPNKSAQSKIKVLNSFINQKVKSLESKYRKLQSYGGNIAQPDTYSAPQNVTFAQKYEAARAAGYTEEEIDKYLKGLK